MNVRLPELCRRPFLLFVGSVALELAAAAAAASPPSFATVATATTVPTINDRILGRILFFERSIRSRSFARGYDNRDEKERPAGAWDNSPSSIHAGKSSTITVGTGTLAATLFKIPRGGAAVSAAAPPSPPGDDLSRAVYDFLRYLDLFGTGLFALTGAVTAGKKGMDVLGMTIVATITAVGGGTVRDLLLGNLGGGPGGGGPVFWIKDPVYFKVCAATAVLTFLFWPPLERRYRHVRDSALPICVADALCLGTFAVVGTQKAIDCPAVSGEPILWAVFGLLTAVFGGLTRDILCLQKPRIMYPERTLYGLPPLLGSGVYAWLIHNRILADERKAACASILVTFTSRCLSFNNPTRLPNWNQYYCSQAPSSKSGSCEDDSSTQ